LQLVMQVPVAEPVVLFVQLAMHTFCSPLHAIGAACIVSAHNKTNPTMTAIAQIALYGIAALVLFDRARKSAGRARPAFSSDSSNSS